MKPPGGRESSLDLRLRPPRWEGRGSRCPGPFPSSFQPPQGDRNKPMVPTAQGRSCTLASTSWSGGRESGHGGSEGEGWGVRSPSGETGWVKGPSFLLGSADPVPASGFCPGCEATLRRAWVGSGWGGPGRLAWGPRASCQGWKPVTWAVDSCSLPGASGGSQGGDIIRRSVPGTEPGTPVPRDVRWAAVSEAQKWNKIPF